MRQWVLSFPYPLRLLLASRPAIMGRVLGIVYRVITTYLIRQAGFTHKMAHTGAVTLIQRFGGALNLNVHFHMLFLDGVYVDDTRAEYAVSPRIRTDQRRAHTPDTHHGSSSKPLPWTPGTAGA